MNHSFDIDIASEYGLNEAIMVAHFQFWINFNKAHGFNQKEGRTWTYNSVAALAKLFPYFSNKQIRGAIDRLVDKGILIKGNFNKEGMDKTTWYSFFDEQYWLYYRVNPICPPGQVVCPPGQMDTPLGANGSALEGKPIPDIKQTGNNIPFTPKVVKGPSTVKAKKEKKESPQVAAAPLIDLEAQTGQGAPLFGDGGKSGTDVPPGGESGSNGVKKLHPRLMDYYWEWFINNNEEKDPPKIDGAQGKALTAIITYLKVVCKPKLLQNENLEDKVFASWALILDNWKLLEKFYQKRTKLTDINSDLQNILKQLKDGRVKTAGNGNTVATPKGVFDAINERLKSAGRH